jgi:hypothetical protein
VLEKANAVEREDNRVRKDKRRKERLLDGHVKLG